MVTLASTVATAGPGRVAPKAGRPRLGSAMAMGLVSRLAIAACVVVFIWSAIALGLS